MTWRQGGRRRSKEMAWEQIKKSQNCPWPPQLSLSIFITRVAMVPFRSPPTTTALGGLISRTSPPPPQVKEFQLGLTPTSLEHSVAPGNEKNSTSVAYFTNAKDPVPRYNNNLGGGSRPVYINSRRPGVKTHARARLTHDRCSATSGSASTPNLKLLRSNNIVCVRCTCCP